MKNTWTKMTETFLNSLYYFADSRRTINEKFNFLKMEILESFELFVKF